MVTLVLEAMGRRSNLILLDGGGRIIDCMRRVDVEMSAQRQVLPGLFYEQPASTGRLPLLEETEAGFDEHLADVPQETQLDRFLLDTYFGISPLMARELAFQVCGETDGRVCQLDEAGRVYFKNVFFSFISTIKENNFTATLLKRNGELFDFAALPIHQYGAAVESETFGSFSELLDHFYEAKEKQERVRQRGADLRQITFPNYESNSSALVKMYLAGEFGEHPDDVNAYAASSFYAVDRFASYKTDWGEFYREGGLVLSDRYTTSNAVHQCSKLPPMHWDGFLNWLFDFEYKKIGIPTPDEVIYLAVDPEVSQRLLTERYQGHEEKKDIQEKDREYIARSRAAAEYCARTLGWKRIECTEPVAPDSEERRMRTIESINDEILKELEKVL